jgi:hypothetical protein
MSDPLSDTAPTLRPVTDFDYRPEAGLVIAWVLRVSGYDEDVDGQVDAETMRLSDVEFEIESMEDDYKAEAGASLTRVHGSHGWRVYEWNNSAVHRYEWEHVLVDLRCHHCKSPDAAVYMVKNKVWASSGLDGWACFRCLEEAIGRRLVPADFKPGLPCNSEEAHHEPELRDRMGLT